jgi:uncharacterized OB-fold protein
MTMHRETSTLYECKACGGCTASEQLACPYCGKSEGQTVERGSLEGGTVTKQTSWYRIIDIVPERTRE